MQVLLADELFVDMAGVFEYDLELKEKGEHRKFLTQTASFKQVQEVELEELYPGGGRRGGGGGGERGFKRPDFCWRSSTVQAIICNRMSSWT